MIDNTTAVSYINSMGGRSLTCNQITRGLWVWCANHEIWLSAAHTFLRVVQYTRSVTGRQTVFDP